MICSIKHQNDQLKSIQNMMSLSHDISDAYDTEVL